jgi:hypothetical protein
MNWGGVQFSNVPHTEHWRGGSGQHYKTTYQGLGPFKSQCPHALITLKVTTDSHFTQRDPGSNMYLYFGEGLQSAMLSSPHIRDALHVKISRGFTFEPADHTRRDRPRGLEPEEGSDQGFGDMAGNFWRGSTSCLREQLHRYPKNLWLRAHDLGLVTGLPPADWFDDSAQTQREDLIAQVITAWNLAERYEQEHQGGGGKKGKSKKRRKRKLFRKTKKKFRKTKKKRK